MMLFDDFYQTIVEDVASFNQHRRSQGLKTFSIIGYIIWLFFVKKFYECNVNLCFDKYALFSSNN